MVKVLPEDTRPARQIKNSMRMKNLKPQGRKKKNPTRPARYYNWLTPLTWPTIEAAAKEVGWQMGASAIRDALKRRNPAIFSSISRQTIDEWIERKGIRPKWKDSVLQRVGFDPQYNVLGQKTLLVSIFNAITLHHVKPNTIL